MNPICEKCGKKMVSWSWNTSPNYLELIWHCPEHSYSDDFKHTVFRPLAHAKKETVTREFNRINNLPQ